MKKYVTSIIHVVIIAFLNYLVLKYLIRSIAGFAVWGSMLGGMVFLLRRNVVTGALGIIIFYLGYSIFWQPRYTGDDSLHILKDLTMITITYYLVSYLLVFLINKYVIKKFK